MVDLKHSSVADIYLFHFSFQNQHLAQKYQLLSTLSALYSIVLYNDYIV